MQRSSSGTVGRHRQELLHRHRAPAFPALFASRGRSALSATALAATLATGVGVAGVAVATPTALSDEQPAAYTPVPAPARVTVTQPATYPAAPKGYARQARPGALAEPAAENPATGPAAAPVQHKDRPIAAPQWAHPMAAGQVTSCFGPRWGRLHAGVDLAAPHGTPVVAAGAGVVVAAGLAAGYGNAVLIDHGNGYLTHYGHLSTIAVQVGQDVTAGQQIGAEGSTGHSTGPHLHFEVHQESYKNPIEPTGWMRTHGVDIGCD